ncbi:aromatic ring-hydroxylating dioxygenase subunit alpha (plasmid) [Cereibacter azotoformans]|uniref:aromatic ring-hydroxylating oxygenase subunit alpha n=1 Tax=Cereibacter azotoformans TaxID=43057 RepID=UPI001EE9D574|nr:aromatic ring-hydroxylating dioxygenase subunit alpha [Cereibacter azotoformans]ULB12387.1 aromatic ring-hydroxylating dioxygenase subunit alpha [Cereibacter azotoformans]
MLTPSQIQSRIAGRRPGYSLSRDLYCDSGTYDADLREIFHREWLFALPACELTKTGSYATLQIGDYPIVVVRGADGAIRAFHNVCRHRGQRICAKETGSAPKLVCPYHQWTYELDGRLLYARDMQAGFDPAEHGLKPVACRNAGGMVFVCLAEEPPAFDLLGDLLARHLEPSGLADAKVAFTSTIVEKGNWKLVIENNRECYHCGGSHPSLCRTYSDNPRMTAMDGPDSASPDILAHWTRCEAAGLPSRFLHHPDFQWRLARIPLLNNAESYTMSTKAAVARRMGRMPFNDAGSLLFYHYPNTWNHFLGDHAITFRVLPIGPTETQVTTKWLVHKDAVEGVDYDLKTLTEVWLATNDEDRQVVEENQKGILSPAYEPGPYSTIQEQGVIQFVDWYCGRMRDRLGSPSAIAAE